MRYLYLLIFIWILGCSSTTDPDPSFTGSDFFPLQVGSFAEYNVTEITYPINSQPVTRTFYLRQEIVESFINQAGGETFVIYRWTREDEAGNWQFNETWNARLENGRLVISEGNIPFIKLSLPVRNAVTWNGNALNSLEEDTYLYTNLDAPFVLEDGTEAQSVTVIQEDFDDRFVGMRDIRTEIYGRNIGLLERRIVQQELCDFTQCPDEEVIISGFDYMEKLIDYGVSD